MSFFIIPIETVVRANGLSVRQEKYVPALGVDRAIVDIADTAICWAACSPAQESSIAGNADAVLIPPLDSTIGAGALATVKNKIEALDVPAHWVTAGMSYRTVLRVVVGMAQLIQAVAGRGINVQLRGNLDITIGSLAAATRNAIAAATDAAGIDRTSITGSTTLREALRDFGQQFAAGKAVRLGDL